MLSPGATRKRYFHWVSVVQGPGEDPEPGSDGVGGVCVHPGEPAFGQALQDAVDRAAADTNGVGQLAYTPSIAGLPHDQGIQDSDDPVVTGDRLPGVLPPAHRSSSSPLGPAAQPTG